MTELAKRAAFDKCLNANTGKGDKLSRHFALAVERLGGGAYDILETSFGWGWKAAFDSAGVRELQHNLDVSCEAVKAGLERVRELTEALERTLVIARQALVYFNTESGRAAMKELEKIEARIKGDR